MIFIVLGFVFDEDNILFTVKFTFRKFDNLLSGTFILLKLDEFGSLRPKPPEGSNGWTTGATRTLMGPQFLQAVLGMVPTLSNNEIVCPYSNFFE